MIDAAAGLARAGLRPIRPQANGPQAGAGQARGCIDHLAADADAADSEQGGTHVRERREIPGSADRPLRRYQRVDLVSEQRQQAVDQFLADAE